MSELLIRINLAREMAWLADSGINDYSLLVSSHILEGLKKSFTNLILKIKNPYIIDPLTYVFTDHNNPEIRRKRCFSTLTGAYGIDLIASPDSPVLEPRLLLDSKNQPIKNLEALVDNVLTYQRTRIKEIYDEISEFEEFEQEDSTNVSVLPSCLIPPYFYLTYGSADWLDINIHCINNAINSRKENEKIYAVLMIDKDMLIVEEDFEEVLRRYKIKGIDGYLVWPAFFNENLAKRRELVSFMRFIQELSKFGKPIYNMYGGLFSLLLKNQGMTGVSHSICYGEHKDAFAAGGMAATIRYYIPTIHSKIPFARKEELEQTLQLKNCECKNCVELKPDDDKGKQLELCGKHFLVTRSKEIAEINEIDMQKILDNLKQTFTEVSEKDKASAYENYYDKLSIWNEVLSQ